MYYIYYNDRHQCLFVTDVMKANRIPVFSSPFLLETVKESRKLESFLGLAHGSSDLTDVQDLLYERCHSNEKKTDCDLELS